MSYYNEIFATMKPTIKYQLIQPYGLEQGIKQFGKETTIFEIKKMQQLHDRIVYKLIQVKYLTELERKRAMESIIFTTEKRDGTIKARLCANGITH